AAGMRSARAPHAVLVGTGAKHGRCSVGILCVGTAERIKRTEYALGIHVEKRSGIVGRLAAGAGTEETAITADGKAGIAVNAPNGVVLIVYQQHVCAPQFKHRPLTGTAAVYRPAVQIAVLALCECAAWALRVRCGSERVHDGELLRNARGRYCRRQR